MNHQFPYFWRIVGRIGEGETVEFARFQRQYHVNDWTVWRRAVSHDWFLWPEKRTEDKMLISPRMIP